MNILFFSSISPFEKKPVGGAEVSMKTMAEVFSKNGHRSFYVAYKPSLVPFPSIAKGKEQITCLLYINKLKGESVIKLIHKYNQHKLKVKLKEIIHKNKINIVYCSYNKALLQTLRLLQEEGLPFKTIMRMSGLFWYDQARKSKSLTAVYENIFNNVDSVNFLHKDLESLVYQRFNELEMHVKLKHSFICDIGVVFPPKRLVEYADLRNPRFKIVMATRFSNYQKRQDILVEAVSLIKDRVPLSIKLIGDGPKRSEIMSLIKKHNLEEAITVESFKNQETLWKELGSADLLCHAADYEGVSKIILEAMALGLPVLASDVSPINGYLSDQRNAFLAKNDPKKWAEKMLDLHKNKAQLIEVSNRGRNYVFDNYNPEKNIKLYEKHFEDVLQNR